MNPAISLVKNPQNAGNQPMRNQDSFSQHSDLSEHSFGISGPNAPRISCNFERYQFFILVGPGGNQCGNTFKKHNFFVPP